MSEPHEAQEAPAPSVGNEDFLTLPAASMPVTAATSVQTFVPMDDEKAEGGDRADGEGPPGEGPQGGAATPAPESIQAQPPVPQTPQSSLTFLLVSGRRRTMSFEPETPIGRVKELVWNTWPSGKYDQPQRKFILS